MNNKTFDIISILHALGFKPLFKHNRSGHVYCDPDCMMCVTFEMTPEDFEIVSGENPIYHKSNNSGAYVRSDSWLYGDGCTLEEILGIYKDRLTRAAHRRGFLESLSGQLDTSGTD